MSADIVREFVTVENPKELSLLRTTAADFGLTVEEVRTREIGVVTAVFLVGTMVLVRDALQSFADRRQGGQVIDLRPGRTLTRRDPNLLYGLVLIVAEDGEIQIRVWEPKDNFQTAVTEILAAITSAGATAVADVSKATAEIVASRGHTVDRHGEDGRP
ncbi:hypothetical protein GCM10023191_035140 [Actinoallomurus oryzae]|uniref:Uncharacterized protein n=1 Tax=Actinoallomurus oryzae TaxID=502180 RepID=A0ABP8Q0L3_9ACTN